MRSYEELQQNIHSKESCGDDVRLSSDKNIYHQLKDARQDARLIERKFYQDGSANNSYDLWESVCNLSCELLTTVTLDIEIASWLCEALLRLDGYKGLSFGFQLLSLILGKHQMNVYPSIDEDEEPSWQVIALSGLNGEQNDGSLIVPLVNVSLTDNPDITLSHYQYLINSKNDSGDLLEYYFSEIKNHGKDNIYETITDLDGAIQRFTELTRVLTDIYGEYSPPTSNISKTLVQARQSLLHISTAVFGKDVMSEDEEIADSIQVEVNTPHNSIDETTDVAVAVDSGYTRQHAIRELERVAQFFLSSEPQSPLPNMLRRIIHWSSLSWQDLMNEVVCNPQELDNVFQLTGVSTEKEV